MTTAQRFLVTGGAGFIGSNLVARLLEQGGEVVVLDNFSTGRRRNLAAFGEHPKFRLLEADIRDYAAVLEAMQGVGVVFHEAALGSVPRSIAAPRDTLDNNVTGFLNVLCAAHAAGVRRLVYASSSSVYGDSPALPKRENATGNPLSPYAASKAVDELLANNFVRVYGMECIGLRYFNVFGRNQDPAGEYAAVIPRFVSALLAGKAPRIYGDGSVSRDFTGVANVVHANLLAAQCDFSGLGGNTVFNIGCGGNVTLNELFAIIRSAVGQIRPDALQIQAEYAPPRLGDVQHSSADISRARAFLGYSPVELLDQSMNQAVSYYYDGPAKSRVVSSGGSKKA
ncbi:MAG: NAD-dependent epimerase/dehydratase family protein [Victivallaceae bacterium]|nr:NAD-dependent epimerase/dehydratase family protein [Victivallaceae bacterium]